MEEQTSSVNVECVSVAKGEKDLSDDNCSQTINSISEISECIRNNKRLNQSAGDKIQLESEVSTSGQLQLTRREEFAGMIKYGNCFSSSYLFM